MKTLPSTLLGVAVAVALLATPCSSQAAQVTFYVDSTQSSLTLSGSAFGLPFNEQAPGSLVTSFAGTITADLTGGVLTFTGGSAITALVSSGGAFSTAPNTLDGPGNYGVKANGFITGYGVADINGAYRNLVFDITAGTAQAGTAPSGMTLSLTAGDLDYGVYLNSSPFQAESSSLVGKGGANSSAALISLTDTTLTLPVHINTGLYSNRMEDYQGTLVAVIPEPSALTLAGLGLVALVGRLCSRGRRG